MLRALQSLKPLAVTLGLGLCLIYPYSRHFTAVAKQWLITNKQNNFEESLSFISFP